MPKEQTSPTNNQIVPLIEEQDRLPNSISKIQSQAHQEANTAVTKAMAVYWSWMVAGLLSNTQETTPETKAVASLGNKQN